MSEINNLLVNHLHWVPFIGAAVRHTELSDGVLRTPIVTRLIEAGVIGVVLMYGTQMVLTNDINALKSMMNQAQADFREVANSQRQDIRALREALSELRITVAVQSTTIDKQQEMITEQGQQIRDLSGRRRAQ